MAERCCSCPEVPNRCLTDECPCFSGKKPCLSTCETGHLAANCLNRAICRCNCLSKPPTTAGTVPGKKTAPAAGGVPTGQPIGPSPCYCDSNRCECYRYREPCTVQCGCKRQGCHHTTTTEHLYHKTKTERLVKNCKCGSGKKSCSKLKCSCRQVLEYCTLGCKCQNECSNNSTQWISKVVRQSFLYPEQETTALVARLYGEGYSYQMEFMNLDKNVVHAPELFYETLLNVIAAFAVPLKQLVVYMSRSPCFHQDCEPRCDILQTCESQKACARLLTVAFGQVKRHKATCNVQMTVKFLSAYVKRGDLYTQQGILNMMEGGIKVEPMAMKEWVDLVKEQGVPLAAPLSIWAENRMENLVRQTQYYINTCRRTIGQKQTLWTSGFHELLKSSVLATASSHRRMDQIGNRLAKQAETDAALVLLKTSRNERSMTDSGMWQMEASGRMEDGALEWVDDYSLSQTVEALTFSPHRMPPGRKQSLKKRKMTNVHRSSTGGNITSFLSSPNKERGRSTSEKRSEVCNDAGKAQAESIIEEDLAEFANPTTRLSGPEAVERMILNFSGRSINEQERTEIRNELMEAVDKIRTELANLLLFLDHHSSGTVL